MDRRAVGADLRRIAGEVRDLVDGGAMDGGTRDRLRGLANELNGLADDIPRGGNGSRKSRLRAGLPAAAFRVLVGYAAGMLAWDIVNGAPAVGMLSAGLLLAGTFLAHRARGTSQSARALAVACAACAASGALAALWLAAGRPMPAMTHAAVLAAAACAAVSLAPHAAILRRRADSR